MPQWLILVALGVLIYGVTLAPVVSAAWKPFLQWVGGVLGLAGVILLVLLVLGVRLPGTEWLALVVIGVLIYGISLAPPVPPAWKPFFQWTGAVLALIGVLWLVLLVLHIPLPG